MDLSFYMIQTVNDILFMSEDGGCVRSYQQLTIELQISDDFHRNAEALKGIPTVLYKLTVFT